MEICDRGPGVPASLLTGLFELFVRVDTARSCERGGTGLGLAIAQRAIRLHDGEVRAENHVTGGPRVIISLPLQTTSVPSGRAARPGGPAGRG